MARNVYRRPEQATAANGMGNEVARIRRVSGSGRLDCRTDMGPDGVYGAGREISVFDGSMRTRVGGRYDLVSHVISNIPYCSANDSSQVTNEPPATLGELTSPARVLRTDSQPSLLLRQRVWITMIFR